MNGATVLLFGVLAAVSFAAWAFHADAKLERRQKTRSWAREDHLVAYCQELEQRIEFLLDELDCATGRIPHPSTQRDAQVIQIRRNH